MKKLFVLALTVIMVLSMAAVSMAAVTVGGEVNFGIDMKDASDSAKATMQDCADAKVTATAVLNDEVTAFVALKSGDVGGATKLGTVGIDETWVKFTEGFGTFKIGHFGWNAKDNLDILAPQGDLNSNAGMNLVVNASEAVSVDVYANEMADKTNDATGADVGALYGFKVKYAADAFGVSVGYEKYSYNSKTDSVVNLNANYKMDAFNFFLTYAPQWTDVNQTVGAKDNKLQSAIIGATYDSDSIYARLETDVQAPDNCDNALGVRLGYKLGNGTKIEYQSVKGWVKDSKATSYIKLNCAF